MTRSSLARNIPKVVGVSLVGLFVAALPAPCPAETRCRYAIAATLPISAFVPQAVVEGTVNGTPTRMLLDTGAVRTLFTRAQVEKMGLPLRHSSRTAMGVGGESNQYLTRIDEMSIGSIHGNRLTPGVIWDLKGNTPFGVVVGADFLFQSDLEIALAARQLRFLRPSGCEDAFVAYWDSNASVVDLNIPPAPDRRPLFTVEVNGQKMRAIIDSGAYRSVIDLAAAKRAGLTPESREVVPSRAIMGVGRHESASWVAPFDSFAIGNEIIKNVRIAIADLWAAALADSNNIRTAEFLNEQPEMLLGADFLRAHRVLFALGQRRLYFSYVGGNVFEVEPDVTQSVEPAKTAK